MGFLKKIWKQRIVEYPGRRRLDDTSQPEVYDVSRAEGNVIQEGDGFTAVNMNGLEGRIEQAFASADAMLSDSFSTIKAYASGDYVIYDNTLYRFTSAKPAGAWDGSKAQATTVAGEIGELNGNLTAKISTSAIANNLTTTASEKVLDARQGKVLSDKIKGIITTGQVQKTYSVQANSHADITAAIPTKTGYKPLVAVLLTTNSYNVIPVSINIDNNNVIAVVFNTSSVAITNATFVWNVIYVKN